MQQRSLSFFGVLFGICAFALFSLPAHATTRTVCASGCDSTTITGAFSGLTIGDIVDVQATYDSSGETLPVTIPAGITLQTGDGATIDFNGNSDNDATIRMNSTSTINGFTFGHVIIKLGWVDEAGYSGQTISSNTFLRSATSSIISAHTGTSTNVTVSNNTDIQSLQMSLVNSATISSNTFYYAVPVSSGILSIGNSGTATITFDNNTIAVTAVTSTTALESVMLFRARYVDYSGNTLKYLNNWTSDARITGVSITSPEQLITGNTFVSPSSTTASSMIMLSMGGDSAGSNIVASVTRNTFFISTNGVSGSVIQVSDAGVAGTYSLDFTTNYNAFYAPNNAVSGDVKGIVFLMNNGSYTLNLTDDYEGFYGFSAFDRLVLVNVAGALGSHLYTSNPYMRTLDADPTNDYLLAPFSPWRSVGPEGESIGADQTGRSGLVNIDDNGVIEYGVVDATSTSVIADVARNYDAFNLAEGTYEPISLASSTILTTNITIDGAGVGTVVNVSSSTPDAGIKIQGVNNVTVSDLLVQNASSARLSTDYYATLINYSYGGNSYNEGDGETIVANSTYVLGGETCELFSSHTVDGSAVSIFTGTSNIHVALGVFAGSRVTLLVPDSLASNQLAVEANGCLSEVWTTDAFIPNVFIQHGASQAYTYDATAITNAGATLIGGLSSPAIAKTSNPQSGILFVGVAGNSYLDHVTSTLNYYGAYASGTETWTIRDSEFSNNTNDFRKTGGTESTAVALHNTVFDTSKVVIDDDRVAVFMRARFRTVDTNGNPISGVSVSSTSIYVTWYGVSEATTGVDGYTAFSTPQPAGYMTVAEKDFTVGGDNRYASPYYATTTATSTYNATSTLYNLTTVNQTVTLVMQASQSTPTTPTNLAVSSASTTRATITWTDASSNETGFVVEYATGTTPDTWNSTQVNTPGLATYTFTTLIPNTVYSFRVAATGTYGISGYATDVTTTTHALMSAGVTTLTTGQTSFTLVVLADADGLNPTSTTYSVLVAPAGNLGAGYYIDASGANNGSTAVWQTTSSWYGIAISSLTCNTSYDIVVSSKNSAGVHNDGLGEYRTTRLATSACSTVASQSNGGGTGGGGGGYLPPAPAVTTTTTTTTSTVPSTSPTSTTQTSFWIPPTPETTLTPEVKRDSTQSPMPTTSPAPLTKQENKDLARVLKQLRLDLRTYGVKAKKEDEDRLALFILRGTTEKSVKIGERERAGVVRDAIDLLVTATFPISDLERMIDGLPMNSRNLKREKQLMPDVARVFKVIMKRTLNLKKEADLPIYNAIMYRVRIPRDLTQEAMTTKVFIKLFRHRPSTPFDWAVLRAVQVATKK